MIYCWSDPLFLWFKKTVKVFFLQTLIPVSPWTAAQPRLRVSETFSIMVLEKFKQKTVPYCIGWFKSVWFLMKKNFFGWKVFFYHSMFWSKIWVACMSTISSWTHNSFLCYYYWSMVNGYHDHDHHDHLGQHDLDDHHHHQHLPTTQY